MLYHEETENIIFTKAILLVFLFTLTISHKISLQVTFLIARIRDSDHFIDLSSTTYLNSKLFLQRMVVAIEVSDRGLLFFIFKILFFGENLTQDENIFRYEAAASFLSQLATFELVSMVSQYSLWDGSEKLQLTRICINLCGQHGCPAQNGNT